VTRAGSELDQMGDLRRSHTCGAVSAADVGSEVIVAGWVQRRRDHGGVIFIDLRDHQGLVQVVFRPEESAESHERAGEIRSEYVVLARGVVQRRTPDTINPKMATGEIEVVAQEVRLLNRATPPPFPLDDSPGVDESTRMRYRIHDLRRAPLQRNLRIRHALYQAARRILCERDFLEIETPMLAKSTPEGARDFLVPSRLQPGSFYALPQSPQLMKQLLMVAGFDRYFQIVRCFRDEDLRADRQPEFTQIDVETSFLAEQEIRAIMEDMIRAVFKEVLDVQLPDPFPVMSYAEAMARYGSDKPDLRVKLELTELTDVMGEVEFKVFRAATELADGRVAALRVPGGGEMPRSEIDAMTDFVKIYGAKGLAYIKVNDKAKGRDGLQSPIVKNLHDAALAEILKRTGAGNGDVIFFGADRAKIVADSMGALRTKIGHSEFGRAHGLSEPGWRPLWVVDFPMFEFDEEEGRFVAAHHPFTSPKDAHIDYLETDPSKCLAKAYDMALNGWEIGGGSVRIHREDVQSKVFRALKIGPEEARAKFGFLLDALQYGAPPHGGIAFGLDRIVTMMAGAESIRDVIAFPKTQRGQCLLTQAPSTVDERQLRELHIRVRTQPTAESKAA